MKREKIILAIFVIPLFLFPLNIKKLRLDKGKTPNPYLLRQEVKSLNKDQSFHSKGKNNIQAQAQSKPKQPLPKLYRERSREVSLSRENKKFSEKSSERLRFDRRERLRPSHLRENIIHLNNGQPLGSKGIRYASDQLLVKFKPTLSEQMREAAFAAYRTKTLKRIPGLDIYKLQIPEGTSVEEMLYLLGRNPDVEYASPNYFRYLAITPNDSLFDEQYALYNSGQVAGPPGSPQGKERADIKATAGWEETKGEETVIIAIIDSGIDLEHPDLINKITPNGYDFSDDDSIPEYIHYHGTLVAGIAGAETNNDEGIAGVAWNCKIMVLKVVIMDPIEGLIAPDDLVIQALRYAADNGAQVVNISLGGAGDNPALEDALKYAYDNGVVIAAAAGNDSDAVLYPAAYDDYCLAVAATDQDDNRVDWSNFGPEVDVAAPGENILSCYPVDLVTEPDQVPYAWDSGTSFSTPHVAGLAALIKSIKPDLTPAEIMSIIRYSADDINSGSYPGKDDYVGYGRINMEKALVPIIISSSKKQKKIL